MRIPWIVLAVCWIGFLANVDNWSGLHWISALWFACFFALVPLAMLGTVRAVRLRERGLTVFGVVTTLVCLPGWGLAVLALASSL